TPAARVSLVTVLGYDPRSGIDIGRIRVARPRRGGHRNGSDGGFGAVTPGRFGREAIHSRIAPTRAGTSARRWNACPSRGGRAGRGSSARVCACPRGKRPRPRLVAYAVGRTLAGPDG